MNISQKIYNLRKQNGYSQDDLAEKLGVSSEVVAEWENGAAPELSKLVEISKLFNVSTDYLLIDGVDDSVSQEVETSEVEKVQIELDDQGVLEDIPKIIEKPEIYENIRTLSSDDIKNNLNTRLKFDKQIYYGVLFGLIGVYIPLSHYDFNFYEMIDLTQGATLKVISLMIVSVSILVAFVFFVRAIKYNVGKMNDFVLSKSAKEYLQKRYKSFEITRHNKFKTDALIFIVSLVASFISVELFYDSDFLMYISFDVTFIILVVTVADMVYIFLQNADYIQIFQNIKDEERKKEKRIERVRRSKLARTSSGIEILTDSDVEKYLNYRKSRGQDKLARLVILGSIALMPLTYFNFNFFDFFNLINDAFFTEETFWRILGLIFFSIFSFVVIKGSINFIREEDSELNKNSVFVLNNSAEDKLKKMYAVSKKERGDDIFNSIIVLIFLGLIYLAILDLSDVGRIVNSILLDVILFFVGLSFSIVLNSKYQESGYRVLFENMGSDEAEKIKKLEKLKARGKINNNKVIKEKRNKAGVKIINSTELDTYINNKVRYGKNIGRAIIFFVLASTPFIPYLYSAGRVFNSTALDNTPRFIFIMSNVCIFIGLCFICVAVEINYKFGLNINYEFILNEFAENKLKFNYKKFKTKRIGKIILVIILYSIAVLSNVYVAYMFDGSLYMFYCLLGVMMFLYAFATYFVITIMHEQKAFKVLLNNVD